jgi:hypothetical protein
VKDSGKEESSDEPTGESAKLEQETDSAVIDGEVTNKERDRA